MKLQAVRAVWEHVLSDERVGSREASGGANAVGARVSGARAVR